MKKSRRRAALLCAGIMLAACDYGEIGGADVHITLTGADIGNFLEGRDILGGDVASGGGGLPGSGVSWSGVWYSRYAKRKLDGYRIGQWKDRRALIPAGKRAFFPQFDIDEPRFKTSGSTLTDDDYFVFYDDTAYEITEGDGGNGGWGDLVTRFIGIVRAVNVFNGDPKTGAIIIEYLDGAYPTWSKEVLNTPLPFFGVYYRILNEDRIQLANAIRLAELAAGKPYHTETATLLKAVELNGVANDREFIGWGVVIPQEREKSR